MTTRIHENLLKGIFILILFIILLLQSLLTNAQSFHKSSQKPYRGFVASFGTRLAALSSNIEKIHQTQLVQSGGQVGLIFGNRVVRAKINLLGYYSSTGNTAGTTDLYSSNAALNFYPLSLISGNSFLIEPYITGSLDYDQYKFYGYYINREPGEINYSQSEAPYLGKIKQVNATIGMGVEVKLKDQYDFIHLFSEVRCGQNVSTKTKNAAFSDTEIKNQIQVIVGVSFGIHR